MTFIRGKKCIDREKDIFINSGEVKRLKECTLALRSTEYSTLAITGHWLGVCHSLFHLYWLSIATRNSKQAIITKCKILVNSGIQNHNLSIRSPIRYLGSG